MISKFMRGGSKSKAEQFDAAARGKSKEEVRKLEQTMLQPGRLPPFTQPQTYKDALAERSVRVVFPTPESFTLFKKYFKVSTYIEQNVTDIKMLIELLEALDEGRLKIEERHESAATQPGDRKRSTPVDDRKQGSRCRR